MFGKIKGLLKKKEERLQVDRIVSSIKSRIAISNGYATERFSLLKPEEDTSAAPEYLNMNCKNLKDFIISPEISCHDLKKLCELNQIELQIAQGWHQLLVGLLVELDAAGWDRKVLCIKEKYARLAFYADDRYDEIIEKFEELSAKTCETCGEKGNQRYNTSWDYVACRKHYLENRGFITSTGNGFEINQKLYLWKDVSDALFQDRYSHINEILVLTFKSDIISHPGWEDNQLYIFKGTVGYGNFLRSVPRHFRSLDYDFLDESSVATACPICGFIAVYDMVCECCETGEYVQTRKGRSREDEHITMYQEFWIEDEGPEHPELYRNYLRNPSYKIINRSQEPF